jgi:SSS family solute:Na+ symporter
MIVNMAALVAVSLVTGRWRVTPDAQRRTRAAAASGGAAVVAVLLVLNWSWAASYGLTGLGLFLIVTALFAAVLLVTVPPEGETDPQDAEAGAEVRVHASPA